MNVLTFEDILSHDGTLVYRTRGVSMEPMLRQNRDLVVIRVPSSRLRKFDVALYRRGRNYVLHRVIKVCDGHYLIRGDNTYAVETVPDSAVIGVLTGFQRKGKEHDVSERGYRLYTWWMVHGAGARIFAKRAKGFVKAGIKRVLGIQGRAA